MVNVVRLHAHPQKINSYKPTNRSLRNGKAGDLNQYIAGREAMRERAAETSVESSVTGRAGNAVMHPRQGSNASQQRHGR